MILIDRNDEYVNAKLITKGLEMKDLKQLEKRLEKLQQEYKYYIRCHVRKSKKHYSYDPGSIDEINKFDRKIFNVKTNINQARMKCINKSK